MKPSTQEEAGRRWPRSLSASLLALAVACVAGCQTSGYRKSDAAAREAQACAAQAQAVSTNLEATTGALNDLVNQPAQDVRPQFQRFKAALDRLESSAERSDAAVARLRQKQAAYLRDWDRETASIRDEEIRRRSETRRAEVSAQVAAANRQSDEARSARQNLVAYLQDIRTALDTDLTRFGLGSVQPWVVHVNATAHKVQTALAQSGTDWDLLSARMSSARVQEPK